MQNKAYIIKVDYDSTRDNLSDSLKSLGKIVEGHKRLSDILIKATGEQGISSTFIKMQNIEAGSIKLYIKRMFKKDNGEAVENECLDMFSKKTTATIIKYMNTKKSIRKEDIPALREEIIENYQNSNGKNILPIADEEIIDCARALQTPDELGEKQNVTTTFLGKDYTYAPDFKVNENEIKEDYVVTEDSLDNSILIKIKKPDYIGNSQWTVIYQDKTVEARILDEDWLNRFQNGKLLYKDCPLPQNTIKVTADISIEKKNNIEQKVFLTIKKIKEVIKNNNKQNILL